MSVQVPACLPLPESVFRLRNILKAKGFQLYVVGGAVRDFIHDPGSKPKDVDVCTDALPQTIGKILTEQGISNFPKGESFGVWVAHIDGEDYEIATFREDGVSSDGRHPDEVKFADISTDYKRRDMTMNALYYEIPEVPGRPGWVIDHDPNGYGIEDARNGVVRIIGDPMERFGEDRLRVLRVFRFHYQHSTAWICEAIDQPTRVAMSWYGGLREPIQHHQGEHYLDPVSGERIQQEFLKGLQKAKSVPEYLHGYMSHAGLMGSWFDRIFPGVKADYSILDRLEGDAGKNPVVVLAALYRRNGNPREIRTALMKHHWPNEVTDEVQYLLHVWNIMGSPRDIAGLTPLAEKITLRPERREHVELFGKVLPPDEVCQKDWSHFAQYVPQKFDGDVVMSRYGLQPGPELGQKISELQRDRYRQSFEAWCK